MIQGGDPVSKEENPQQSIGNGGPGYTLPAEFNKKFIHKKGALAAARMGDAVNPKKESSGSQFYIVEGQVYDEKTLTMFANRMGVTFNKEQQKAYSTIGGTPRLDANYTVFGEVIEGLELISKISNVKRDKNNLPLEKVVMKVSLIK
jgi:peptidyl-prolyl cis-trans isomerase B (cyclophilin B)